MNIYALKLHETIEIKKGLIVTRVPGGWLYIHKELAIGSSDQTVFVPFNNEFQEEI